MQEEWVELLEWPGYLVSNLGRVWHLRLDREVKMSVNKKGYPRVNLSRDGHYKNVSVHRLVAFGFVDGYFEGALVNHIDGIKTNNVYTNLEWATHKENIQHAVDTGLIRKLRTWVLEPHERL